MNTATPDDLAMMERLARAYRNELDHATLALWGSQESLLAALGSDDECLWRDFVAVDARRVASVRNDYDRTFAVVAALRSAASPQHLVARALTPDEAARLAAADGSLVSARLVRDEAADCLAWWMEYRTRGDDGVMANVADEGIALWTAERDRCAAAADAALDARAPLLAAQWEAA